MGVIAKSIIIDIADNWGDGGFIALRSVDFWADSSKIANLSSTDFTAYSTTSLGAQYDPDNAFDTSLSKTGVITNNEWYSSSVVTNQRLICVFNVDTEFDEIRINNGHSSGTATTRGAQNVKIHYSTDAITSTVYDEAISNSAFIYDGVFAEHVASNVEDEEILTLMNMLSTEYSGIVEKDSVGVARELNFYSEPDLSMSIGTTTSNGTTGLWNITLPIGGSTELTVICEGEGTEQSQVFNNILAT